MPKVLFFLLLEAGIVLAFRMFNHFWPPLGPSLGIIAGGAYYLWRKGHKRAA